MISIVPRAPSSTEILAMVLWFGACRTLTKSYGPRTAYWARTLPPIASTSLFTSWVRFGLFFKVLRPSSVSLVSIQHDVGLHRGRSFLLVGLVVTRRPLASDRSRQ